MELRYEFYIGATPEKVWETFVSEGTRQTFFGCVIHSTFEAGAPFEYVGPGADGDETVHVYGTSGVWPILDSIQDRSRYLLAC